MRKTLLLMILLLTCGGLHAQTVFKEYLHSGPYNVYKAFLADSTDIKGVKYTIRDLLGSNVSVTQHESRSTVITTDDEGKLTLSSTEDPYSMHYLSCWIESENFGSGTLAVQGPAMKEVYLDGTVQRMLPNGNIMVTFEPRRYELLIKCIPTESDTIPLQLTFTPRADMPANIVTGVSQTRKLSLDDVTDGVRIGGASLSPSGKLMIVTHYETFHGGKAESYSEVIEPATGRVVMNKGAVRGMTWMPRSELLYQARQGADGRELVTVDPYTGAENVLASGIPEGYFYIAPTEDYLIYSQTEKAPEKHRIMKEIIMPDDRMAGWRDQALIFKYDLATGVYQRLTYGHTSTSVHSISEDGRYLLFSTMERDLTKRPSRTSTFMVMDMQEFTVDTLLHEAKYLNRGTFSPDGKKILFSGSAEAFDGIGLNLDPGQISNTYDTQLFLYDLQSREAQALTRDFDPAVSSFDWNPTDNLIYVRAEDRDYVRLYTIDPARNGAVKQLNTNVDVVQAFSVARYAPTVAYYGESLSQSQKLYVTDARRGRDLYSEDLFAENLKDVELGKAEDWNFVSSAGETIYGRYYLPPTFDPEKKYPMLVYYYGGTSPTARNMLGSYSAHMYAAKGFIVYVLQPSGATGFGQKFSALHVNAWGERTADDIIEGVKKFTEEHSYVNKDKIGCFGASYGGFMTMYLQTRTDIFAAAISHAGISNIASYWGVGTWGAGYSEAASAGSYPWNAPELYAGHSPLFNADKMNTPLLLLHGTVDNNVPPGESMQMFVALKTLGKEVALVEVEGENHGIVDYEKRRMWIKTTEAWFTKWLKDDPKWWEAMYPSVLKPTVQQEPDTEQAE